MSITREQGLDVEALEGMVDRHGLHGVVEMLAHIASEKAEHVRTNWQDDRLGKLWDKRMILLDLTATKMRKLEGK